MGHSIAGSWNYHEMPLGEDGVSCDIATSFSETLRIWTEGRQYKLSELIQILSQAGFHSFESIDSHGPYKFIVGTK